MSLAWLALLCGVVLMAAPLPTVDEGSYTKLVAANKGKVVLVNFWATWCVPCRAEMPQLVALQNKLKSKGLQVVTISADEPEADAAAQALLQKNHVAAPSYRRQAKDDDKFIELVDAKWRGALPALFLYDRTGKKMRSFVGETPMSDIEAAVTKLL